MKKVLLVTAIIVLLLASSLPAQAGQWDWVKSANLVDLTHSGYGMLILPMNSNDEFIFYIAAADYEGQDTTATCGISYYEDPLNYFVKGTLNTSVSKENHFISWRSDGHHLTILTCVYASGYIGNIHMVAGDNAVLQFPTDSTAFVSGSWNIYYTEKGIPGEQGPLFANITESGNNLTGTIFVPDPGVELPLWGTIDGSNVNLSFIDDEGTNIAIGIVSGNTMSGTFTHTAGGTGTWRAERTNP